LFLYFSIYSQSHGSRRPCRSSMSKNS
jgi:hypothetical protein